MWKWISLTLWGGLAVCGNAVAQDVVLHDSIEEITVQGDARAKDVRSTAPVFTLNGKDFQRMGLTDIAETLRRLPSVTLRDYGGAGGMKTVSVRGFGAGHTGVVYDGVALSNCQTGHIDLSRYSLDNVRSLSLAVGDNDDIFIPAKNAASAATLLINTLRIPTGDRLCHVTGQMKVGPWGITNPFLRIEKNISERVGVSLTGDYFYAENDYPYTIKNVTVVQKERRNNNWMSAGHAEANVVVKPTDRSLLNLKLYYYDNSRRLPGDVNYYVNESKEQEHDQNFFAQLGYRQGWQRGKNALTLACIAKFNYSFVDYRDPSYPGGIMDHKYWQREAYASARLMYETGRALAVCYAADYTFNNLSGSDQTVYRDPFRHTVQQSFTAKYHKGRFTAIARALYSLYNNGATAGASADDISHLSPSLSVNYRLLRDEELYLRLSYKDIFRSPSFNEQYYKHYGSTTLKPECTRQINLGLTWSRQYGNASALTITTDAYHNRVTDKIVAVPQTMFMWTNVNLGKVRSVGTDVTGYVVHRISEHHSLIFSCNYSYQKIVNRTDKASPYYGLQIAYTPEHLGGASLAWENPCVSVVLSATGVSHRWANNEHYNGTDMKGYAECGITAYKDMKMRKNIISLRFDVKNLFDKQYEIVRFYPMPGRSWLFTLAVRTGNSTR